MAEILRIREIRAEHFNKRITVEGKVSKIEEIKLEITIATFECKSCGAKYRVSTPKPPSECVRCKGKSFELLPNECEYRDLQQIKIRDTHRAKMPQGFFKTITVNLRGDLIGKVQKGDDVIISGTLKPLISKTGLVKELLLEAETLEIKKRRRK